MTYQDMLKAIQDNVDRGVDAYQNPEIYNIHQAILALAETSARNSQALGQKVSGLEAEISELQSKLSQLRSDD